MRLAELDRVWRGEVAYEERTSCSAVMEETAMELRSLGAAWDNNMIGEGENMKM